MMIEDSLHMAAVGDAMDEGEEITAVAEEDIKEEEEEGGHPLVSTTMTPIVVVVMEVVTEMTSSLNVDEGEGVEGAEVVITMTMETIDLQGHPRGEALEWAVGGEDHSEDVAGAGAEDIHMEEAVVTTIVVIMEVLVVVEEDENS